MKKLFIILTVSLLVTISLNAQESKTFTGTVEKVSGIPMYLYSEPQVEFEVVGKANTAVDIIKVGVNMNLNVYEKGEKIVKTAFKRKEAGKIPEFDAIISDINKEKILAIKYKNAPSLNAEIQLEEGIAIYIFSQPNTEYEKIADLPADFSMRAESGMLSDKISSMVRRYLKKVEKGELKKFDAIIFNPKDLNGQAIKFKK
jgi:hypothetical protein